MAKFFLPLFFILLLSLSTAYAGSYPIPQYSQFVQKPAHGQAPFNPETWRTQPLTEKGKKQQNELLRKLVKPKRHQYDHTPSWQRQNVTNLGKTKKKRRSLRRFNTGRKSIMDNKIGPLP